MIGKQKLVVKSKLSEYLTNYFEDNPTYKKDINRYLKHSMFTSNHNIFKFLLNFKPSKTKLILVVPNDVAPFDSERVLQTNIDIFNTLETEHFYKKLLDNLLITYYNDFTIPNDDFDFTMKNWEEQGIFVLPVSLAQSKSSMLFEFWKPFICDLISHISEENSHIIFGFCTVDPIYKEAVTNMNCATFMSDKLEYDDTFFSDINRYIESINGESERLVFIKKHEESSSYQFLNSKF